jgi:hypothetical protein
MASLQAPPSFEITSRKVKEGSYSSARKRQVKVNIEVYWLGRQEGKKLTLVLEVPSCLRPVHRVIFVLEGALYDCSSYKSLVDESVAGFFEANFNQSVLDFVR